MTRLARSILVCVALSGAVAAPGKVFAHPAIDEARAQYATASFDEALASLRRAERSPRLTRTELRELLALRATVHFAMRSEEAFRRDLVRLATIAPGHRFDPALPPGFLEAWSEARSHADPIAVRVEVGHMPNGVRLTSYVVGSSRELVRGSPRVFARPLGTTTWHEGQNGILSLPAVDAPAIEYRAEVRGPGRVVLARDGTATAPRVVPLLAYDLAAARERERTAWLIAGAATLAAVALGVTLAIVLSENDEEPAPSAVTTLRVAMP